MREHQKGELKWLTFDLLSDLPHGIFFQNPHLSHAISLKQIHGDKIVEAEQSVKLEGDALITDQPELALLISHADCQAAIFYDPIHYAIANVHCGWRGNVQNIYKKTIEKMKQRFGSRPEELLVGISPSLGPPAEFRNYKVEFPESFWGFQTKPTYFNLWEISRWQLTECGILSHHLEIAEICTFSNPEFHSYRRNKTTYPHHVTIVQLSRSNWIVN